MSHSVEDARANRKTRLIVDTGRIRSNAALIRSAIGQDTALMAVVKANGYGHGAIPSANAAIEGGATWLGVATVAEAVELRHAGVSSPILVLGPCHPTECHAAAANRIDIGVGDTASILDLLSVLDCARDTDRLSVHLKIDTGMRRFGVSPEQALEAATMLSRHPRVDLNGIYSHFAEADNPDISRCIDQSAMFRSVVDRIRSAGIDPGIVHLANSAALLRTREFDFEMVRAGICLYGIEPSADIALLPGMLPALEWRATVMHTAALAPGDRVGYGGTYVASGHERVALLPVGYADGYPRAVSNAGWVGYEGVRCPVRGRVSMDQVTVGIPSDTDLGIGDEVVLIGDPATGAPTANVLGEQAGTIGYEIVSRLSRRVPVEYTSTIED